MESMGRRIRHRRLRGLVIHHRRHPSAHPRRLVKRVRSWGERPVNGVCRWCGEHASSIQLTWHGYCLDAYRVASGQKPGIRVTMCEGCAGPADELDHRLAINVARALGPQALRRSFTLENLQWLCSSCHRRNTRLDRQLARFLSACSMDWRRARQVLRVNRAWAGVFLAPLGIADASAGRVIPEDVRTAA